MISNIKDLPIFKRSMVGNTGAQVLEGRLNPAGFIIPDVRCIYEDAHLLEATVSLGSKLA